MGILNFHIINKCFIFYSRDTCQTQEILRNFRVNKLAVVIKFRQDFLPDGRPSFGIEFFHDFDLFGILDKRLVGKHHNS